MVSRGPLSDSLPYTIYLSSARPVYLLSPLHTHGSAPKDLGRSNPPLKKESQIRTVNQPSLTTNLFPIALLYSHRKQATYHLCLFSILPFPVLYVLDGKSFPRCTTWLYFPGKFPGPHYITWRAPPRRQHPPNASPTESLSLIPASRPRLLRKQQYLQKNRAGRTTAASGGQKRT